MRRATQLSFTSVECSLLILILFLIPRFRFVSIREIRGSTLPFLLCLFTFVSLVCFVVQISGTYFELAG